MNNFSAINPSDGEKEVMRSAGGAGSASSNGRGSSGGHHPLSNSKAVSMEAAITSVSEGDGKPSPDESNSSSSSSASSTPQVGLTTSRGPWPRQFLAHINFYNPKSRFGSVVLNSVLGPPRLASVTHLMVSICCSGSNVRGTVEGP